MSSTDQVASPDLYDLVKLWFDDVHITGMYINRHDNTFLIGYIMCNRCNLSQAYIYPNYVMVNPYPSMLPAADPDMFKQLERHLTNHSDYHCV